MPVRHESAQSAAQGRLFDLLEENSQQQAADFVPGRRLFEEPPRAQLKFGLRPLDKYLAETGQTMPLLVADLLDEMDWEKFEEKYAWSGRAPYAPKLMVGIVLFGILNQATSLRHLEALACRDLGCMWVAGGIRPDHSVIGRFLLLHRDTLTESFFEQVTAKILKKTGTSTKETAIDGTMVQAACSRYRTVKREALNRKLAECGGKQRESAKSDAASPKADSTPAEPTSNDAETTEIEAEATTTDAETTEIEAEATTTDGETATTEAKATTTDAETTEIEAEPTTTDVETTTTETEATTTDAETATIETEATTTDGETATTETEVEADDNDTADDEETKRRRRYEAADAALAAREQMRRAQRKPVDALRISTTEPEAAIQPLKNKSYAPSYKASALANNERIIVAIEVDPTSESNVVGGMLDQAERVGGARVEEMSADAGYCNETVIDATIERDVSLLTNEHSEGKTPPKFSKQNFRYNEEKDTYTCPAGKVFERSSRNAKGYTAYRGKECEDCPFRTECISGKNTKNRTVKRFPVDDKKEALREVMQQPAAKKRYRKRKAIIEPVFASTAHLGLRRFRRFGLVNARMEFALFAVAHNITRLAALRGRPGGRFLPFRTAIWRFLAAIRRFWFCQRHRRLVVGRHLVPVSATDVW
jgi:transposase